MDDARVAEATQKVKNWVEWLKIHLAWLTLSPRPTVAELTSQIRPIQNMC